jgi:hypothetical protein
VTLISSEEISINEPRLAITSFELGIKVKSIVLSELTVEVIIRELTDILPVP